MGLIMKTAALLGLFSAVLAVPAPQAGVALAAPAAGANSTACATVAQAFTQQKAANPKGMVHLFVLRLSACNYTHLSTTTKKLK